MMATMNNKKEGKDTKHFSSLLKIVEKGQLLILDTEGGLWNSKVSNLESSIESQMQ